MNALLLLLLFLRPTEELVIQREFRALYKRDQVRALHIPCILPTTKLSRLGISSLYGYRTHPRYGGVRHHNGIDISVKNADVVATGSGVVKRAGYSSGYGNFVEIDHQNGYSTLYGHLSSIFVEEDQIVDILTVIGRSGATGVVTGEHIHYEVRRYDQPQNPLFYILLLYDCLSRTH
ncbi:M23 family metallopeptidase [Larkinella sp. GY13]|uniref:M23 family metallopeptidase n=1 Tax=Larkinella sp. GY13 TaxID=3453720 RepID=UPI003EEB392F